MSHTASDIEYFYKMGIDPDTRQQREHSVSCGICHKATWNISALCDIHRNLLEESTDNA